MGSGGSRYAAGRPGWRRKCEQSLPLDIRRLRRKGPFHPGSEFGWHWTLDGEPFGNIRIAVGYASVQLSYNWTIQGEATNRRYDVQIEQTACHYGGFRPWFKCPWCSRRCAVLYGLSGDGYFGCRKCLRLAYSSEAEDTLGRLWRKQRKLEAKLNWLDGDVPVRPKGMRHKTLERILDQIDALEDAKDADFLVSMARLYGITAETPEELINKLRDA
jgi:hypothetical protein